MTEDLRERMARAIAASMFRSQSGTEDDQKGGVMADRRLAAESAADAASQPSKPAMISATDWSRLTRLTGSARR